MPSTHVLTKGNDHIEWGRDTSYNCNDSARALSLTGEKMSVWTAADYKKLKKLPTGRLPEHEQLHPLTVWQHGQRVDLAELRASLVANCPQLTRAQWSLQDKRLLGSLITIYGYDGVVGELAASAHDLAEDRRVAGYDEALRSLGMSYDKARRVANYLVDVYQRLAALLR